MKKELILGLLALFALGLFGCDNDDDCPLCTVDEAPQAPQGVFSVTGDGEVTIFWTGLYNDDIVEYVVGWNDELLGEYEEVGRVSAEPVPQDNLYNFLDTDVENGTTYFYAVWAVDASGHVSEPSYEAVFDTPRSEGQVDLYSKFISPTQAGFDLSAGNRVPWDATTADIFVDHDTLFYTDGFVVDTVLVFYLNAASLQIDIQDMGYTGSFDEISWAPDTGWSELRYYEIVPGHTYVIWTSDLHYAKMRATATSQQTGWVSLQWAYQTSLDSLGNRELIGPPPDVDDNQNAVIDIESGE